MSEPAPLAETERVQAMDVLRGIALFGVFLVNFVSFASSNVMATEFQLLSLPSAGLDHSLLEVVRWLAFDKANSLFAFLFGLGFFVQAQRMEARGADFESLYRRRMTVLLAAGLAHQFFVWTWDILHLYALAGFLLLPLRRLSNRALLIVGLTLAAFGRTAQKAVVEFAGESTWADLPDPYTESAALLRQEISARGDYAALVANFFDWTLVDYIGSGLILGWLAYALGRFLLGAWVGRHGWIQNASQFQPGWKRVLRFALPLGLVLEGVAVLLFDSSLLPVWSHRKFLADVVHLVAVPVLAAGYVAAVIVALQGGLGRRLLASFAPAGRMALTNYLLQSVAMGFVLFGIGPGLALAGKIGTTAVIGIVVGVYAVQMAFSHWWLSRYRYGPMEWLWRGLTYQSWPVMRRLALRSGTFPANGA